MVGGGGGVPPRRAVGSRGVATGKTASGFPDKGAAASRLRREYSVGKSTLISENR